MYSTGKDWQIHFSSVYHAEMALATLHGTLLPSVEPPFVLRLSASDKEEETLPADPLLSQFVHSDIDDHPLHSWTAQELFRYFRSAGPLVSVRTNVDIGRARRVCTVEYWDERHANYARLNAQRLGRELAPLEAPLPPFSLRTYDPWKLYCTNLGDIGSQELQRHFEEYGIVLEVSEVQAGTPNSNLFVLFGTKDEAAQAICGVRDRSVDGIAVAVRYHVPVTQSAFREDEVSSVADGATSRDASSTPGSDNASPGNRTRAQVLHEKREAKLRHVRRAAAIARRKDAEAEVACTRQTASDLQEVHETAQTQFETSRQESDAAQRTRAEADEAVVQAERALEAARERAAQASRVAAAAAERAVEAKECESDAWSRMNEALEEKQYAEAEQDKVYDETQPVLDDTADLATPEQRQEELAKSIRKMKEMRDAEEAERWEKEMRRRSEEVERQRKIREEEERAAREKQEREEREAARYNAYLAAAAAEEDRCRTRDIEKWNAADPWRWDSKSAIRRFQAVSCDFDDTTQQFCETRPLTLGNIPWPVLRTPISVTFETIQWDAVEKFCDALKQDLPTAEYKTAVEKAHRRFHPDKWRSRGLLATVLDEDLRKRLEDAGNIVSQALTPIWQASRSM
ncbi:RNA recognition motif domain-containing protein [Phanerochaete sordida]|uniref:RNA recognition motif domain-containing protein n=1 Tax=Phanerochaete sordida TaxID=48140 RepID=A0A9P3GD49_9APHY|nr:RNA recognition motif domain-containing protein [Phanerochaete sordida]